MLTIRSDRQRRAWRAVAAAALTLGIACVAAGLAAPSLSGDREPRRLDAAGVVDLPSAGLFGGTVAVYARAVPPPQPAPARLGCSLTDEQGRPARAGLSPSGTDALDRLVVEGTALAPYAVVVGKAASVRCDGGAALTPIVVRAQPGVDDMVPMAAFSLASLMVVVGGAGAVLLSPGRA